MRWRIWNHMVCQDRILFPLFSRIPCSIFPIDMVKTRLIEQIGQQQRLYVTCPSLIIANV